MTIAVKLSEIAKIVDGQLIGTDQEIANFVIDGRKAQASLESSKGECYIAIKGERVDGHDFCQQAFDHGAVAAIVAREDVKASSMLVVKDPLQALVDIGCYCRAQFKPPVFALTGSCGKTTVKEMIKAILPQTAYATPGNLNNHIGVPLSLSNLDQTYSHAVFELGANHLGEIGQLSEWVKPDISLITIIAPAHLEGFGSIEGVANTKGEIFAALNPDGLALVNADDERVSQQAERHLGPKLFYAIDNIEQAAIKAINLQIEENGCYQWHLHYQDQVIDINLQVPGRHNVANGLAAAAAAIALGSSFEEIKAGLEAFDGVSGRLAIKLGKQGVRLIDDTYNANLRSVKAAIDVLAKYPGQKVFVLGELGEVGKDLPKHYQEIGQYAKDNKIDCLFTCGDQSKTAATSFAQGGTHFAEQLSLMDALKSFVNADTTILVKGSRSAHMEHIIEHLQGK